ncbi:MAG: helix-hairpin-helix domain-containing protein [Deltaproteobacteria bacterium]|nr:helix-hairpin-helix domain-containing protein [Deltaproteobacteria bacterium]
MTACTAPTDATPGVADVIEAAFTSNLSASEEVAVLELANTASQLVLDDDVDLDSRAAAGIVANRPLADLASLDAVPYVGDNALNKMLDYIDAQANAAVVHGIAEGSDEAAAIILLVNLSDHELLDDTVGLNSRAADNILDARFAGPIDSLTALDAVSYMGPAAFATLLDYVVNQGLVIPQVYVHGISEQSLLAIDMLTLVNSASEEALDDVVGLNSISAGNIVEARDLAPIASLSDLDAVSYVGAGAFDDIIEFIQGGYGGDPCLAGLGLACQWTEEAKVFADNNGWNDNMGDAIAIDGDVMVVGAAYEDGCTDAGDNDCYSAGAAYVFAKDGSGAWQQEGVLKPMDASGNGNFVAQNYDWFGQTVAISGDTIVVGVEWEDGCDPLINDGSADGCYSSGAAYVYSRSIVDGNVSWNQEAYLKPAQLRNYDYFGSDVAIDGDTIVIGAEGDDSCNGGVDAAPALDADATFCNSSGAAYVFERDSQGVWSQDAYLKGSNPDSYDDFGTVAISGSLIAVGADGDDSYGTGTTADPTTNNCTNSGAVTLFVRIGEGDISWAQEAYLKADNAWIGDGFGDSVDIDLDTLAVGAPFEDGCEADSSVLSGDNCSSSGAVYTYLRTEEPGNGISWTEEGYLKASNTANFSGFGTEVAIYEDSVLASQYSEDGCGQGIDSAMGNANCWNSGSAQIFRRDGFGSQVDWSTEAYVKASDSTEDLYFGESIDISGGTAVIGAIGAIDESACGVGEGNPCDTGGAYVLSLQQ